MLWSYFFLSVQVYQNEKTHVIYWVFSQGKQWPLESGAGHWEEINPFFGGDNSASMDTMVKDFDFSKELKPLKILLLQYTAKPYIEKFVDED